MNRKSFIITFVFVLCTLVVVFIAGPRVEIDTTIHAVELPADLDQYLAESEAAFADLVPGTEKTIVWAGSAGERTPLAVVYLHGFSASRQETAPLADLIADSLGANLFYTRFTGHGRSSQAMADGSVNTWLNDGYEAFRIGQRLGERVLVIGVSTGGTVATWLAAQSTTDHVAAWILISPNYAPADSRTKLLLWPWGRQIAELTVGPVRNWQPQNELHAKYWTQGYPTRALLPMMGLVSLVPGLDLTNMTAPALVIYSPNDQVVNPAATESTFTEIGSPRKRLVPYTGADDPEQHILAGEAQSPGSTGDLASLILDFITE